MNVPLSSDSFYCQIAAPISETYLNENCVVSLLFSFSENSSDQDKEQ